MGLVEMLLKRLFDYFKRFLNRVRVLDDYRTKLREEECVVFMLNSFVPNPNCAHSRYDKKCMEMLRQIVEREQECAEYQRKKKEREDRYFAGLQVCARIRRTCQRCCYCVFSCSPRTQVLVRQEERKQPKNCFELT